MVMLTATNSNYERHIENLWRHNSKTRSNAGADVRHFRRLFSTRRRTIFRPNFTRRWRELDTVRRLRNGHKRSIHNNLGRSDCQNYLMDLVPLLQRGGGCFTRKCIFWRMKTVILPPTLRSIEHAKYDNLACRVLHDRKLVLVFQDLLEEQKRFNHAYVATSGWRIFLNWIACTHIWALNAPSNINNHKGN